MGNHRSISNGSRDLVFQQAVPVAEICADVHCRCALRAAQKVLVVGAGFFDLPTPLVPWPKTTREPLVGGYFWG